jgi:hypothetical protein
LTRRDPPAWERLTLVERLDRPLSEPTLAVLFTELTRLSW